MGRERKVYGKLYEGPSGKRVRVAIGKIPWGKARRILTGEPMPRGKTGSAAVFTTTLKELAPLVYAFIVDQLSKPERKREPMVRRIIAEWKGASGRQRPSSREFAAFVIERAMGDVWRTWGIKRPYSEGDWDNFLRKFVHGHRHALGDYHKALRDPRPWPQGHAGDWLRHFFGESGEAAREFNL